LNAHELFAFVYIFVINDVPSLRFVYGRLGDLQVTAYFKGIYVNSGTASVLLTALVLLAPQDTG